MKKKYLYIKTIVDSSLLRYGIILCSLVFALTNSTHLSAQDSSNRSDSLQNLFATDTTFSLKYRLNLALKLSDIFSESNPKKADKYVLSAIDIAEQLNDTTKVITLWIRYADSKSVQCNYKDSDEAYTKAKELIQITGVNEAKANIYYLLGVNYYSWSKYSKSRIHYEMAFDEYTQLKDKKGIARSLSGLSAIASNYGDYELAIGYSQRSRDIYIEIDDPNSLANTILGLGVILENWGKTDRAMTYYQQAYEHYENEKDILQQINLLLHIGDIYRKQKKFTNAIAFFNKAINMESEATNKRLRSIGYSNLGEVYLDMKEYDTALYFQEKALAIKYEVGDKKRIAISLLTIGKIYFSMDENKLAEEYILQAFQLANKSSLKEIEMNSLLMLSEINNKKLNYSMAYSYLVKYLQLKDEIFDSEGQEMLFDLDVRYESQKIEKENEILKQKDAINTLELEREKDTKFFTLIFLVFIIIIALTIIFFISSRTKQSKRNYAILAKKNKEITTQKERLSNLNKELVYSREQYRSIVENATIGMYQTLPNGQVKFANMGLINMLGYNNLSDLKNINLNQENKNRLAFIKLIEEHKIISGREDIWTRQDGTSMYVNESAWVVKDNKGKTIHYEGIVEDISKRKEVELALHESQKELRSINNVLKVKNKEFEDARNQAIAANEIKSQFIANVSHEIRTPMNSIIGFSELLSNIVTEKRQLSYVNAIKSSSKSLLTLINDVLDMSKIQAGEIDIIYEPMSFINVVQDIEQVFKLQFINKKLQFITNIGDNVPQSIFLDRVRIRQVLFNLIGNSVKFTDKGTITLEIDSIINNIGNVDLAITITDTGIGVSKSEQKTIFEAFKQSKNNHEKSYGGTGLGLSISKRLIEAMGGTIELKSEPGKGSKFSIFIANIEEADSKSVISNKSLAGIKNLISVNTEDTQQDFTIDLGQLDNEIIVEIKEEFKQKWEQLNNNHVINEIVSFAETLLSFAKRKNNYSLITYCEALLFSSHNFDIENINNLITTLGTVLNSNDYDNQNQQ